MADTRVTRVPAVANVDRWLSVAYATAERPVHDGTRPVARRGFARLPAGCWITLGRDAVMGPWRRGRLQRKNRVADAASSEPHSSFRQPRVARALLDGIGTRLPARKLARTP